MSRWYIFCIIIYIVLIIKKLIIFLMCCIGDLLSIIEANNICYIYEWKVLTYWGAGLRMVGTLSK